MSKNKEPFDLVYSDSDGNVFDYPGMEPMFRTGNRLVRVKKRDCIKLPEGSFLFSMPERTPVYFNRSTDEADAVAVSPDGDQIWAVSSFLPSGYLRTYLPAGIKKEGADPLTLWAYSGVVISGDDFYVPAIRIDDDPRSDPGIHQNDEELGHAINAVTEKFPENRLVKQLGFCSTEYRCLCARNFFLGRFEAPVPTTPGCNARCIGCLSEQQSGAGFVASQERLKIIPTPDEIAQVMIYHSERVDSGVVSFGQGCEGEPLLRGDDLARAVKIVRNETDQGTIHLNTNGSLPKEAKKLIEAGLDSIRISMNSPSEAYYNKYYRPQNYSFADLLETIKLSLDNGLYVSLNLLFMPGFTDMESEIDSLFDLLHKYPVHMIQTRNLNIDPDLYFQTIEYKESEIYGIDNLLNEIKENFSDIRLGYYNPSVKDI